MLNLIQDILDGVVNIVNAKSNTRTQEYMGHFRLKFAAQYIIILLTFVAV